MKTKYVCHGLISLYVNFHNNRTMWSTNLLVKICRWGEKEKEPNFHVFSYNVVKLQPTDCKKPVKVLALFPSPPPTSLKHELYGPTSGFTRLIMKTKYACYGLISLHANFHDNRTTTNMKICRWGEKEKEPRSFVSH